MRNLDIFDHCMKLKFTKTFNHEDSRALLSKMLTYILKMCVHESISVLTLYLTSQ